MVDPKIRAEALAKLARTMKKEARKNLRVQKFSTVFSYEARLQAMETDQAADPTLLRLLDGLEDSVRLAEYLFDEVGEALDVTGGTVSYCLNDGRLRMNIMYLSTRRLTKKEASALATFNKDQFYDGWGECGGTELPEELEEFILQHDDEPADIICRELSPEEVEQQSALRKDEISRTEEGIDDQIREAVNRMKQ